MVLIAKAIREHGWDAFEVMELNRAKTYAELMEMEKAAIVLYQTVTPNGYNILPGGGGLNSPFVKSHPAWNKGVPHTVEARKKMSMATRGEKNFRARSIRIYGVEYPTMNDACSALGLSRAQLYRRIAVGVADYVTAGRPGSYGRTTYSASMETRAKMSAARKGAKNWNARQVEYDGQVYPSIEDACQATGLTRQQFKGRLKNGAARYLTTARFIVKETVQ